MSAMPAGWTELSESPRVNVVPDRVQRRVDRRAELMVARRSRRRWAVAAGAILVGAFAFTVGMLELLH
jgi:Tfp pilus assembly protein PilN